MMSISPLYTWMLSDLKCKYESTVFVCTYQPHSGYMISGYRIFICNAVFITTLHLLSSSFLSRAIDASVNNSAIYWMVLCESRAICLRVCVYLRKECLKNMNVWLVIHKCWVRIHKQNFQFYKWLFVLQIENYIFTNRTFVSVDSKTRVQLKAYL